MREIRRRRPGEKTGISASEWNAIRDALVSAGYLDYGFDGGQGRARRDARLSAKRGVLAYNDDEEDAPEWAVFGVSTSSTDETAVSPTKTIFKRIDGTDPWAPFLLFTNAGVEVPAGAQGVVYPVNAAWETRLRVEGESPLVGEPCGVVVDTWGVGTENFGMMTLAVDDAGEDECVSILWSPPTALLGKTDATVAKGDTFDCELYAGAPGNAAATGVFAAVTTYLGSLPGDAWIRIDWNGLELIATSVECEEDSGS